MTKEMELKRAKVEAEYGPKSGYGWVWIVGGFTLIILLSHCA